MLRSEAWAQDKSGFHGLKSTTLASSVSRQGLGAGWAASRVFKCRLQAQAVPITQTLTQPAPPKASILKSTEGGGWGSLFTYLAFHREHWEGLQGTLLLSIEGLNPKLAPLCQPPSQG